MDSNKIIIKVTNKVYSLNISKFEREARVVLKNAVIPQVKNAAKNQNFVKKECLNHPL